MNLKPSDLYMDGVAIDQARQFAANALCQCAVANHITGGIMEAITSDGQKWSVKYEKVDPYEAQ